jgi:hypothetical protein
MSELEDFANRKRPLQIEVLQPAPPNAAGTHIISIYEVPSDCYRVVVDTERIFDPVCGYRPTNDQGMGEKISCTLVMRRECIPFA